MSETVPVAVEAIPTGDWDERVRVFRRPELVDVFVVITERYVVLIDTLDTPGAATQVLESIQDHLRAGRRLLVVNSHADWDHAWGNAAFTGPQARWPAPIIGHRLCRERLLSTAAAADLEAMRAREPERFGTVQLVPPTIMLEGQVAIHGGDLTLELIPTPGHQPDHLAFWIPELRILIAADTAEAPFPSVAGPTGIRAVRDSLARLIALEPQTVLACHAPGSTTPALLEQNLSYLDELERRCRAALMAGCSSVTEAADLGELVGYPADMAASGGLPAGQEDYYRASHADAIRAMLTYLTTSPALDKV